MLCNVAESHWSCHLIFLLSEPTAVAPLSCWYNYSIFAAIWTHCDCTRGLLLFHFWPEVISLVLPESSEVWFIF